jgi:hypothetical protein
MLEKETAFYEAHREELRSKYHGKRVVIAGDQVLGIYETDHEAYEETVKTVTPGQFMIKYIPEDPAEEIIYIYPIIQHA